MTGSTQHSRCARCSFIGTFPYPHENTWWVMGQNTHVPVTAIPEFRVEGTTLQYKLTTETTWIDLFDFSTLVAATITATATATTLPPTDEATASVDVEN